MSTFTKLGLAALITGLGAAYYPVSETAAHEPNSANTCAISTASSAGSISLIGIAKGKPGETGQYRLAVNGGSSGGTTSTSQGGAFDIGSNGEAQTGHVRLTNGGIYNVRLQIEIGGETYKCSKRVGDHI
jgi:curli production assembly/transport CsgH protein